MVAGRIIESHTSGSIELAALVSGGAIACATGMLWLGARALRAVAAPLLAADAVRLSRRRLEWLMVLGVSTCASALGALAGVQRLGATLNQGAGVVVVLSFVLMCTLRQLLPEVAR